MTDHSLPDRNSKPQQTGGTERQGFTLDPQARHAAGAREAENEATIGKRIVAFVIDACLLLLVWPLAALFSVMSFFTLTPVLFALIPLVPLVYHTAFIATKGAATPGMRAMGLKVVREIDGGQPDWPHAAIMVVLFYMSIATSGLLLLWCLFDSQNRCLHDIFSGTRVVRANAGD